jgi:hypothetical protein
MTQARVPVELECEDCRYRLAGVKGWRDLDIVFSILKGGFEVARREGLGDDDRDGG